MIILGLKTQKSFRNLSNSISIDSYSKNRPPKRKDSFKSAVLCNVNISSDNMWYRNQLFACELKISLKPSQKPNENRHRTIKEANMLYLRFI